MTSGCEANVFPFGVCSNSETDCNKLLNDGISIYKLRGTNGKIDIALLAASLKATYNPDTIEAIKNGAVFSGCALQEIIRIAASRVQYFDPE